MEVEKIYFMRANGELPFGILITANTKIWSTAFCYDRKTMYECLDFTAPYLSEGNYDIFYRSIQKSGLPSECHEQRVIIPGYIGLLVGQSLSIIREANRTRFGPWTGWPLTSCVPGYSYIASYGDVDQWQIDDLKATSLFNSAIIVPNFGDDSEFTVNLLNSVDQWHDFIMSWPFDSDQQRCLRGLLDQAILPKYSPMPPRQINGYIAGLISMAYLYRMHVDQVVENFGLCPWQENYEIH